MITDSDIVERFFEFFRDFTDNDDKKKYHDLITSMVFDQKRSLEIDYTDLRLHDPFLAKEYMQDPILVLDEASEALEKYVSLIDLEYVERVKETRDKFYVRIHSIPETLHLRAIRANHVGKLIQVQGIVVRTTDIKPMLLEAHFECMHCGERQVIPQESGRYSPPVACTNQGCPNKKDFRLLLHESKMIDWQIVTIQEKPEDLLPGASPRSMPCRLLDDLVDRVRPGDRVTVVGILNTSSTQGLKRGSKITFDPWIEVTHIASAEDEGDRIEISPQEEREIREFAKDPYIHQKFTRLIAPMIHGLEREKEGIMLLLFGGRDKDIGQGVKLRGQPNILMVGDPGVAKCVIGETKVLLATGKHVRIDHLVESHLKKNMTPIDDGMYATGSQEIFTLKSDGSITLSTASIFWKRSAPQYLYTIQTSNHKTVTVTPTHPFYFLNGLEIRPIQAKDLREGMFIATPKAPIMATNCSHPPSQLTTSVSSPSSSTITLLLEPPLNMFPGWRNALQLLRTERNLDLQVLTQIIKDYEAIENGERHITMAELTQVLRTFAQVMPSVSLTRFMLLVSSDLDWEPVSRITKQRSKDLNIKWVYDLQVEHTHNFIANGIIIHNSQLLKYVQRIAPRGIYTSGKGSSAAGLCVAPGTKITLASGETIRIEDLVEPVLSHGTIKVINDAIIGRDDQNRREVLVAQNEHFIRGTIIQYWKLKAPPELIRFDTPKGHTLLTPHTPVLTRLGELRLWKPASLLSLGDHVLSLSTPSPLTHSSEANDGALVIQTALEQSQQHWVPVINVATIQSPHAWVYDLSIDINHNFLANNHVVHNTAAVIRDPETGELTLEAGAIVLADKGIACVTGDTRVFISRKWVKVQDLFDTYLEQSIGVLREDGTITVEINDLYVPTFMNNEFKQTRVKYIHRIPTNEREILKLKVRTGETIRVTHDHEIPVLQNGKLQWLEAQNLKPGMTVITAQINLLVSEDQHETPVPETHAQILERVEPVDYEPFVYDLTLDTPHENPNYVANGFVVHNCIDEFDKMDSNDRSAIHEAMEQHSVSIAKAGIIATLNSRTAILAAANPRWGRYDPQHSPSDNINLPPTIISRFDLIFVVRDIPEEEIDRARAKHILTLHQSGIPAEARSDVSLSFIKKYIAYAREHVHPKLTPAASKEIEDFYVSMRNRNNSNDDPDQEKPAVAITARQLEAIVRLAEAHARVALREEVTREDAIAAIDLMKYSLKQVGYDFESNRFDIDILTTGKSATQRDRMEIVYQLVVSMVRERKTEVRIEEVIEEAKRQNIDPKFAKKVIKTYLDDGTLYQPTQGYIGVP